MFKRLLLFVVMLLLVGLVYGQPPFPGHGRENNAGSKEGCIYEIDNDGNIVDGSLGTATLFMVSLGVIFLFYEVRKNNKAVKEDKRL